MEEVKTPPVVYLTALSAFASSTPLYAQEGEADPFPRALAALATVLALASTVAVFAVLRGRGRLRRRLSGLLEQKEREIDEAALALQESEKRYHRLFDDPAIGKILIDPIEEILLDANTSAREVLGCPAGDLAGMRISDLDCKWLRRILDRPHPRGSQSRAIVESFEHTERGETRYFEAWVSAMHLAGQRAALLTTHDVTERRHLEEQRVRQEERERYISELEDKKAEVEARNAEMERFVYTVSHDLKSPLVTIRGFLGYLRKDLDEGNKERLEGDIGHIDTAVVKMGRLLSDLLELSRIGRVSNPPEEISVAGLVHEVTESALAAVISQRGAVVDVSADLPYAYGDRQRMEEVIQNLIENAVKFMGDQEEPRVEVTWRRDGEETIYCVRDNGVGIEPRYHDRIFGLFDRLEPTIEGSGVGLALVKRIVEVHEGRIWVESEGQGRGTTFCFSLGSLSRDAPSRPSATPSGL